MTGFWKGIRNAIGIYQLIYGFVFFYIAVWNTGSHFETTEEYNSYSSIQAYALYIDCCITLFSGMLVFLNWPLARKTSLITFVINGLNDLVICISYFQLGNVLAYWYLSLILISLFFTLCIVFMLRTIE